MKHIQEIQYQGLLWVNITRQSEKELGEAQKKFALNAADIKECLPPFQRPKIVNRDNYYFIVLHFPVFDRESRRMGFTEVDFFLSPYFLITVHDNSLPTIDNLFSDCKKNETLRKNLFSGTSAHVLFELLSRLLDAVFPILLHTNDDINSADRKLFMRIPGKEMAEEILRLKTNIVTFRRTMQGHKMVMDRLIMYGNHDLHLVDYQQYINSLREFNSEIWHMLESQKESIYALHETNQSLVQLKTNDVMKTLTIISVVTFPLTLIATLFAIHAEGTPLVNAPGGFWVIFGLILVGAITMVFLFRKRGWM